MYIGNKILMGVTVVIGVIMNKNMQVDSCPGHEGASNTA